MLKSLLYCFLLLGFHSSVNNAARHPLHVSTTDISYNKNDGKLEIVCTLFTDDFENALSKQFKTSADLNKADMHKAMDNLIKSYIANNLHIKAGNTAATINYLGFENNHEAIDVYLESDKITQPKRLEANVSLLHNLFDDQINIVHMTVNGARKSGKITFPDRVIAQTW